MSTQKPPTAAVIGTGTIALGWIALFAARGLRVRVSSTRPDAAEYVTEALPGYAATLPDGALDPATLLDRISFVADLRDAVADADLVQENAPEDLALKQKLFARVADAAPPGALLLSSTSTLLPDQLGAELAEPGRVVVGHPFNPPHIVPLVEVVGARGADPALVARAVDFYRGLGKHPVVLRRALPGFVANRLQTALLREAIHLVREGVVTVGELDTVVTSSIGQRWAVVGPFEAFHLGGGPGGLRHWFAHLGAGLERGWESLGRPPADEETVETILAQADLSFARRPYPELAARRDRRQNAVIAALRTEDPAAPAPDSARTSPAVSQA
ncbi:3-hydroxyacyl-CoA dehydrogenase NAD-binding domain-containing protein [Streptomyces sp. NPDC057307]|uniref:3-hydroxyacyl-CoA dehydrogenase NAD-binding domain-containing protein n=1 Tax=Streptomyces sp. NPDC057307 TaxID=3346096 RepID=UPI003645BAD2